MEYKQRSISEYWEIKEQEYESMCIRCGGCCGAYDDPCVHLKQAANGKYYCEIYERRLGFHHTVSGEKFECVLIHQVLEQDWPKDYLCAYKKKQQFGL